MSERTETAVSPVKDLYEILRVHPDAEASVVNLAYWHLARVYGRDRATDPSAGHRLDELNDAYEVLGSAVRREQYDEVRAAALNAGVLVSPGEPAPELDTQPPVQTPEPHQEPPPPVDAAEIHEESPPLPRAAQPERHPKRLRVPRPAIRAPRLPSWQAMVCSAMVVVLSATALVVGVQPILIIALLGAAFVTAAIRLVRGPLRLARLPARRLAAADAPRIPRPRRRTGPDPERLRRSTQAMLKRWEEAADGLSDDDPLAAIDQRVRSLAKRRS